MCCTHALNKCLTHKKHTHLDASEMRRPTEAATSAGVLAHSSAQKWNKELLSGKGTAQQGCGVGAHHLNAGQVSIDSVRYTAASATEFIFVKIKKQNLMFFLLFVSFVRRTNAEVLDNPWKLPTSDRFASSFDQAALWSDDWLNNCYHFWVHTSLL